MYGTYGMYGMYGMYGVRATGWVCAKYSDVVELREGARGPGKAISMDGV